MSKQLKAAALCRVSSVEQLENNSLNRQRDAVLKAASDLGVVIPDDYWWSGSVSSKRGTNVNRKDLNDIMEKCKKDKNLKYVIVDEPDRFMRSIDEAAYFEVQFRQLGVTVWYASDPELNKGDLASKLLKFTKYLSAEGSNEERQNKSISGQTQALNEGRYPFMPKPGYMRGYERGIPEVHPVRGPALQAVLKDIAYRKVTPTQGLINLNASAFMTDGHSSYKMDKFRKIVTDPFYAGIVEINKQVKVRNEKGLHEPLITLEEHEQLLRIMEAKKKTQIGPRKNGNPDFPISNLMSCEECVGKQYGRFVGFRHSNGKNVNLVYEKYRCRSCKRYLTKQELHQKVQKQFNDNPLSKEGYEEVLAALKIVWKQEEGQKEQDVQRISNKIKRLTMAKEEKVEALTDPKYVSIKDEILSSIEKTKNEISELEGQMFELQTSTDTDKEEFLRFAYDFIENMGQNFLNPDMVSKENRLRCKQIIFPAGFYINAENKVYTPQISPLYRLATKKKDTEVSSNSHMVRARG